jgi:4-aminobutyrate aminotransferase-like enzyme
MISDEVQAGFGRSGKWFTVEHFGITPDLIACGKGLSSSLPIAAVIGRNDIMDMYKPGSMTSTHSGSPLPVVAATANIKVMKEEKIVEHAAAMEQVLAPPLHALGNKYSDRIGKVTVRGMVGGLQIVQAGTKKADPDTAMAINEKCFQKGLLMFAPVGTEGQCIKIAPPLITPEDALKEGVQVLSEALNEVFGD